MKKAFPTKIAGKRGFSKPPRAMTTYMNTRISAPAIGLITE